ncbi:hypothetical protein GCM10010372_68450 [Streptomyces tauricus]|uniref:Uncharacterized protein n=1 Tax=Streptomyces tauricus TaxID=68274 RepID=A0ABZ1JQK7_9ACTN|nr:hypothetical protein [Streptomyces tauricus]MCW8096448.1 hypothetical protein [Streptomyces tauricus]GHA58942.1 hypothetical protein GCM10010372_68450 [Streptomyces tauricus]
MRQEEVHWQDVERVANLLGELGREFTSDDRRALKLVFRAAAEYLKLKDRRPILAGAKFIPGPDTEKTYQVFKVDGRFKGPARESKGDPTEAKLPESGPAE